MTCSREEGGGQRERDLLRTWLCETRHGREWKQDWVRFCGGGGGGGCLRRGLHDSLPRDG